MDDAIEVVCLKTLFECGAIANVDFDKVVARIFQVLAMLRV